MRRAVALALLLLGSGTALADPGSAAGDQPTPPPHTAPAVAVRAGTHDGYGRLVFEFPARPRFVADRHGDVLELRFETPAAIGSVKNLPRNVLAVTAGAQLVDIKLTAGAQIRTTVLGGRLVLDILDPAESSAAPPAPAASPAPAAEPARPPPAASKPAAAAADPPSAARPVPTISAPNAPARQRPAVQAASPASKQQLPTLAAPPAVPPGTQAANVAQPVAAPVPAPLAPVHTEPLALSPALRSAAEPSLRSMPDMPAPSAGNGPIELTAQRADLAADHPGAAITLPFATGTGAAAFRRGTMALVVFDERRPIDLSELKDDPTFSSALVQLLSSGTLLRLNVPADRELSLTHGKTGWTLAVVPGPLTTQPIGVTVADRQLKFAAGTVGQVVTVADPDTGRNLLVGTQREAGQAVPIVRRTPEFVVLQTWQGVAVEPQSDRPALRPITTGFLLSADAPDGLAVSPTDATTAAQADAVALTRSFDFTADTTPSLLRRMQSQVESAAAAQPLARMAPREQAAQSMISLGMGAEAEALLQLGVSEDPRAATDPTQMGLSAVAALLAGRMADANAITDSRLPPTDEVALWRAVRDAMRQEGSPGAAAVFAAETPLIMAYPEALQARLLPLATETMALGGQVADATRLLAKRPGDPTLALARGMVAQAQGNTKAALAAYDGVAASSDQLASARAALRAAQLRLSSGEIGPDKAADAEEKLLFAWRGDGWEVALRRQIADLRAQAGQWRQALSMLRESQPLFADDAPAMHDQMLDILARLLRDDGPSRMAPLDLVALVEENADLLPDGAAGETMAATFADRLVGLDLPQRAEPVLEKLTQSATGAAKGLFGLQLATLKLNQADPTGAMAALANSASDSQSAAVAEQRSLLQARALAATGETAKAVDVLHAVGTPAADEARASVLEAAHDWPGATAALVDYVARVVPTDGPLDDPQAHVLLRLASAAAQAGNETVLAQLRHDAGPRIAAMPNEQKLAETFRFLTERPIGAATDLPRAAAETQTISALPAAISQLNHTASK
jgi:hypothetical protein